METENIEPLTALMSLAETLQQKLDEYSRKDNANQEYIKRQQTLVNELYKIVKSLVFYDLHPAWTFIQDKIDASLKLDPSIESFQINLSLRPVTNHIAILDINLF